MKGIISNPWNIGEGRDNPSNLSVKNFNNIKPSDAKDWHDLTDKEQKEYYIWHDRMKTDDDNYPEASKSFMLLDKHFSENVKRMWGFLKNKNIKGVGIDEHTGFIGRIWYNAYEENIDDGKRVRPSVRFRLNKKIKIPKTHGSKTDFFSIIDGKIETRTGGTSFYEAEQRTISFPIDDGIEFLSENTDISNEELEFIRILSILCGEYKKEGIERWKKWSNVKRNPEGDSISLHDLSKKYPKLWDLIK